MGETHLGLDLSFEDTGDYLVVGAKGEWTREGADEGFQHVSQKARSLGRNRILLDVRELSAPQYEMDRFEAGEAIANLFPPPFKVVAVRTVEKMSKFAENVAVNRGAHAIVLTDIDEAVRWLTEDSE